MQAGRQGPRRPLGFYQEQRLVIFHRRSIFDEYFYDPAFDFTFDLIEKFHGFDDTDHLSRFDIITHVDERRLIRRGTPVESTDHRTLYSDSVPRRSLSTFGSLVSSTG